MNSTADLFIPCLEKSACKGSEETEQKDGTVEVTRVGTCSAGYQGNMCNACSEGYGKSNDGFRCFDCSTSPNLYL